MAQGNESDSYVESLIMDFITKETTAPQLLPVGLDTKLIESGILDSLSILRLVAYIQERFEVAVIPEDVVGENFETVKSIAAFIKGKSK
jgi:acyl carrier protein